MDVEPVLDHFACSALAQAGLAALDGPIEGCSQIVQFLVDPGEPYSLMRWLERRAGVVDTYEEVLRMRVPSSSVFSSPAEAVIAVLSQNMEHVVPDGFVIAMVHDNQRLVREPCQQLDRASD